MGHASRVITSLFIVWMAVAMAACGTSDGGPEGEGITAFEDVAVIPMDGRGLLRDRTVVVQDGRVEAVTEGDAEIPAGARRIDGRGRYLIPGLTDMHVHPLTEAELLEYVRHGVTSILIMRGRPTFLNWRARVVDGELLGPTIYSTGAPGAGGARRRRALPAGRPQGRHGQRGKVRRRALRRV